MKYSCKADFSLLLVMLSWNVLAQYTALPEGRLIQLDDYDDLTQWAHTGAAAPPRMGAALKAGTEHTHVTGWKITEARTGYAGSYGMTIPPLNSSNYAVNLRNINGAAIESPYYADGIGTLYFEAVNTELSASFTVYIATNMVVSGGGFAPMQPAESATMTYGWVVADSALLNYSGSDFGRFANKLNYSAAVKFKIVRTDPTVGYGPDDQFLVVDNIRASYPPSSIAVSQLSATLIPAADYMSGVLTLRCRLDQVNTNGSVAFPTMSLIHRTALRDESFGGWTTVPLVPLSNTGNGRTGVEFEGLVLLPAEGRIEYYYTSSFDGFYVSPDFTGLDHTYPSESLSPQTLYQDGMDGSVPFGKTWKFEAVPLVTELSDERILTFDDYQDADKWIHTGNLAPPRAGKTLLDGILHIHANGWRISEARTGYAGNYGLVVPPRVVTNYAANLRNFVGAFIESPLYQDGVGTIYFEAVNSEDPVVLHVYITTNMFDYINWESAELGQAEGGGLSNVWHEIDVLDLNYTVQGQFNRYVNTLNYRGSIKVKLARESKNLAYSVDDQFLVVDNIRISPPPTDVLISKTKVVGNPGYPQADIGFTIRCSVSNADMLVPTVERTLFLVHRWRYLTQQVDEWQTNQMSHVAGTGDGNGNQEIYESAIAAPEQVGDIEYFFFSRFSGTVYQSPDYTGLAYAYPSENLSPQMLRGSTAGGAEFSLRLREHISRYGALYVVTDQHPNPIRMDLIGDHQWRGMVPLTGIVPTNLSWTLMAEQEWLPGAVAYETNRTYWAAATMCTIPPDLPYGGVLAATNAHVRTTVEVDASGYMMVSFNTETLEFTATRAQYQNFNTWVPPSDCFCESSVSSDRQNSVISFDNWALSEAQVRVEPFNVLGPIEHSFAYEPFSTPGGWVACSAGFLEERGFDCAYSPVGVDGYRNRALRLNGTKPIYGPGFVYNSTQALTDGLKNFSFKGRISLISDSLDICYHKSNFLSSNYSFRVQAQALAISPESPSLSVVAYYQDYKNYYEFRVVQKQDAADTAAMVRDARVDCVLLKWADGSPQVLSIISPDQDIHLLQLQELKITLFDMSDGATKIKCSLGTLGDVIAFDDLSNPLRMGTFGVVSSDCASAFTFGHIQNSTPEAEPVGSGERVVLGGVWSQVAPQIPEWFVPADAFTFKTTLPAMGVYKRVPDQTVDIYIQSGEYGTGQEPAVPGTLEWIRLCQVNVNGFTSKEYSIELKRSQIPFLLLQVAGVESDVVVDELTLTSWRGEALGGSSPADWSVNAGWVVCDGVGVFANQILQFDLTRAYTDEDQALCTPRLEQGLGSIEFDYKVVAPPARITIQYSSADTPDQWYDVDSISLTSAIGWTHAAVYVGVHEAGFLRVLNDRRGGYDNALVQMDHVSVWDCPEVDRRSWVAYNAKISAADPMRLLLDESQGCFLNNSITEDVEPLPLDADNPYLQSPELVEGVGEISFLARAYDANEPATVYLYASVNGWGLPHEHWTLVKQFDNISNLFYRAFSWQPPEGDHYDSLRLETAMGAGRLCLEEVVVSAPHDVPVVVSSTLSQPYGTQNALRRQAYALRGRAGFTTNILYQIDDWYRLTSLTSNGVEQLPPESRLTSYGYDLRDLTQNVDLQATVSICDELLGFKNNSSLLAWIVGYPEAPLVPMNYGSRELTLEEQYMLDADPTTLNAFHCETREFSFDAQTNLHVRLRMSLNENSLTRIQGNAVLKLQAISSLLDPTWTTVAQYSVTNDSFDHNHESLAIIADLFDGPFVGYDPTTLFFRWVLESPEPQLPIGELQNQGDVQ